MFYIIGLGLGDYKDITVKGLEIVRKCAKVYLENYTSILINDSVDSLEKFYGCKIVIADRNLVEENADEIIKDAKENDIALLVIGDPFGATTHTDIVLRARNQGIPVQIIHNASIINAVGCCGLQLYNFGEIVSVPFWTENWQPDSFFDKILSNFNRHLHTLCLLDIKVKEMTLESLTKKNKEYMPPRFMTAAFAAAQILKILDKIPSDLNEDSSCVGLARIGSSTQKITVCSIKTMSNLDLGPPLHSLIIPSPNLHPLEEEYILQFQLPQ